MKGEAGSGEDLRGYRCRLCHSSIRERSEGRAGRVQKIAWDGLSNAPTYSDDKHPNGVQHGQIRYERQDDGVELVVWVSVKTGFGEVEEGRAESLIVDILEEGLNFTSMYV